MLVSHSKTKIMKDTIHSTLTTITVFEVNGMSNKYDMQIILLEKEILNSPLVSPFREVRIYRQFTL